jgi:hypothetical protein
MTNLASPQTHREVLIPRGPRTVGFPTPDQIRASIQQLVADNEIDQAHSLAEEGLSTYPESEGVIAIAALVCIVRQDWSRCWKNWSLSKAIRRRNGRK